ncbi:MAG: sensor histidine kinase [Pseudoduganella sp.]|jgi:two-component sensor histidine kinase|nr:sensor histidine kinase [Pseudoduganella sp.]
MQRVLTSRSGILLYLTVWLLLGLGLGGAVAVLGNEPPLRAMLFAVPVTLLFSVGAGFSAYYMCKANPLRERSPVVILVSTLTAAICAGFFWVFLMGVWNGAAESFGAQGVAARPQLTALLFSLGVLMYGLLATLNYLFAEFVRARQAEQRELESKLMARNAELRMLRTQIDPHFLFNSLNSISALTSIDAKRARDMTQRLSDFFRQSLGIEAQGKITLEEEVRLVGHFLAIEKVRFGARLGVEQAVDEAALPCLLPPMILQPLVENAVKHGIGGLPEGGMVRIDARREGSLLKISVENDTDPDTPPRKGNGIGLVNVRERLAAAYGHQSSVHCTHENNRYRVALTLPAETKES